MNEPLAGVLISLVPVLESLGIRYAVVGSLASSIRGMYRVTADADLLAEIRPQQAKALAQALGKDWYADPELIGSAIRAGRAFNIIHIPTAMKVDIFPARSDYHYLQMERATPLAIFASDPSAKLAVTSPEDIILSKLEWLAAGGEASDMQWKDILGVVAMSRDLDMDYLNRWATRLGVSPILARALHEGRSET